MPSLSQRELVTLASSQRTKTLCWGLNFEGQLGDGTLSDRYAPVSVLGLPPASKISLGDAHTCAVGTDGIMRCWGDDTFGELGDGAADGGTRYVPTPVVVAGLP